MADENKAPVAGQEGADNTPKDGGTDAFGMSTQPPEAAPKQDGEGEGDKNKGGDKKYDAIPDDHPTIVALKNQIEQVKSEYGGNLSGQREVIDRLTKEIDTLKKGGKPEGAGAGEGGEDVLFKDIKWSKDLTKEEREEMTETEIKQMDVIAEMQTKQNEMYSQLQQKNKQEQAEKVEDLQSTVKSEAMRIATEEKGKEDVALANQIIESVKQFNLDGLTEAQVKERVAQARKLLPDYQPPKEQPKKNGKTVDNANTQDDPFGVDKIVEEATKGSDGSYAL